MKGVFDMLEKALLDFVTQVQTQKLGVEAVAVADGEKLLFEHHFVPSAPRCIYSHTKSFTSTAVGMAIAEGKLSLTDKPVDFFPESLPDNLDPRWHEVTLRDCLMMSSGVEQALLMWARRSHGEGFPDFAKYIFSHPIVAAPGTHHFYNNGDTYLCGRMVEKVTGKTMVAYLYEKLFEPMGIGYPTWEMDPQGHSFGASGLFLTIDHMIKLGQLYVADGKWQGRQLLDPAWVKAAGAKHIETPSEIPNDRWLCGYGYQFWKLGYPGAFRADGAYGQITAILPEKGLAVSVQCSESGNFDQTKPFYLELLENL